MMIPPSSDILQMDIADRLQQQNLYQRLGLVTNAVSQEAITAAHAVRCQLIRDSYRELPAERLELVQRLLDEALATLSSSKLRRRYDRALWKAHAQKTQPVDAAHSSVAQEAATCDLPAGRYVEQHILAEGDRSVLHSGLDTHLNRRVIIKKIRAELVQSDIHQQLFRDEAELFAGCNAGNLVKILDYDLTTGTMVLERLKCDLSDLVTDKGCDHRQVREILRDALNGLASLHSHKIAHGRVELRHLLMDDAGGVKLAVTPGMTGCVTALRPGRHAMHLAPELLNSNVFGPPGLSIDIYALGFVALELLVGKQLASRVSPAIESASQLASGWLLWHSSPTDHLPPLTTLVPGIPADLAAMLSRMTSKQQHERFPDAIAAREALRDHAAQPMTIEPEVTHADQADWQGAEVLGAPPPLRPAYDYVAKVSWREVCQNPRVLLEPRGRNHACLLGLITILASSMLLMAMRPNSPPVAKADSQPVTVDEEPSFDSVQEIAEEAVPDEVAMVKEEPAIVAPTPIPVNGPDPAVELPEVQQWQVNFRVHPSGVVESVRGQASDSDDRQRWTLKPGSYRAQCRTDERTFETTVAIPPGHGQLTIDIDAPADSPAVVANQPKALHDPFEDVRGMTFHPANFSFEYVGAKNQESAQIEVRTLRQHLSNLINRSNIPNKRALPTALPDRPMDPRVAFTFALLAYHRGDYNISKNFCLRSIRDAKYWSCPFVLPFRLLTQIHISHGEYSSALATCRSALQWINQMAARNNDVNCKLAGDHLAWWAGSILAFVQETRPLHWHSQVDLDGASVMFREVCTDSQWTKYRIARCQISERMIELSRSRGEELTSSPEPLTSETSRYALPLATVAYAQTFAEQAKVHSSSEGDQESESAPINPVLRPSPKAFVSYRPCDLTSLADATLLSLHLPGEL